MLFAALDEDPAAWVERWDLNHRLGPRGRGLPQGSALRRTRRAHRVSSNTGSSMASRTAVAPATTRRSSAPEPRLPQIINALLLALATRLVAGPGAEPGDTRATVAGGVYRVTFDAVIDAPIDRVAAFSSTSWAMPRWTRGSARAKWWDRERTVRRCSRRGSARAPVLLPRHPARRARTMRDGVLVATCAPRRRATSAAASPAPSGGRRAAARASGTRRNSCRTSGCPRLVSRRYAARMLRESVCNCSRTSRSGRVSR